MTGKRLRELYQAAHADAGVTVEEAFEDLDHIDRDIWDDFALLVEADTECTTMTLGADAPGI